MASVAVTLRVQQHCLNLISLLCSCFGSCHYQTHFPDSDPSFHLHFWHELTSWYKVRWIIIECIQGRGVLLSGLNLMQSHLFNFTTREHLQVQEGENKATQKRGRHCRWGWTGLALWPLASRTVSNSEEEPARLWRGRGISACDMSLWWQVLIYIEVDVDVQSPEGGSPTHTLPSLSGGDNERGGSFLHRVTTRNKTLVSH